MTYEYLKEAKGILSRRKYSHDERTDGRRKRRKKRGWGRNADRGAAVERGSKQSTESGRKNGDKRPLSLSMHHTHIDLVHRTRLNAKSHERVT